MHTPLPTPRTRRPVLATALLLAGMSAGSHAAEFVLGAGPSTTSTHNYVTHAVFLDGHGGRRTHGPVTWQPMLSLGWIDGRDKARLENDAFVVAGGVHLVDWWRRAFFSFQFGLAHDTNDALSSHGQFVSSIGWQGDRVVYTLRHISNGKVFSGPNLGETMLLVGLRF